MGAAASFQQNERFTQEQCRNLAGIKYDDRVFQIYMEGDKKITLKKLKELDSMQYDVYLSHDCGINENGRNNHQAIYKVFTALLKRGLIPCFDEEQSKNGISKSQLVIVFITKTYKEKVCGSNASDNCKIEYNYALSHHSPAFMIPVIMESRMRQTMFWDEALGTLAALSNTLHLDFSDDIKYDENMNRLEGIIRNRIIPINEWYSSTRVAKSVSLSNHMAMRASSSAPAFLESDSYNVPLAELTEEQVIELFNNIKFTGFDDVIKANFVTGDVLMELANVDEIAQLGITNIPPVRLRVLFNKISAFKVDGVPVSLLGSRRSEEVDGNQLLGNQIEDYKKEMDRQKAMLEAVFDRKTKELEEAYKLELEGKKGALKVLMERGTSGLEDSVPTLAKALARTSQVYSGVCIHTLAGHTGWAYSVLVSPDSDGDIFSACNNIMRWTFDRKTRSYICTASIDAHSDLTRCLQYLSPNQLLSCSDDKTIKLWDLNTNKCLREFNEHNDCVRSIVFLNDTQFVSGSDDKTLKVWDIDSSTSLRTINLGKYIYRLLRLSPDTLVIGLANGIMIYNLSSSTTLEAAVEGSVFGLVIDLANNRLITGTFNGNIYIHNISDLSLVSFFDNDNDNEADDDDDDDNHDVLQNEITNTPTTTATATTSIGFTKMQRMSSFKNIDIKGVFSLLLLPDGRLVVGSAGSVIRIWNMETRSVEVSFSMENSDVYDLALTRNGEIVSTDLYGGLVRIFK